MSKGFQVAFSCGVSCLMSGELSFFTAVAGVGVPKGRDFSFREPNQGALAKTVRKILLPKLCFFQQMLAENQRPGHLKDTESKLNAKSGEVGTISAKVEAKTEKQQVGRSCFVFLGHVFWEFFVVDWLRNASWVNYVSRYFPIQCKFPIQLRAQAVLQAEAKHIDLQVPLMLDGWYVLGKNLAKCWQNHGASNLKLPRTSLSAHIALLF